MIKFLGSAPLAIALLGITALFALSGTIVEGVTGSHLAARRWVYDHPFFLFLLALFFVNILVSALLRWPFEKRHIPFLMTHLGLLMVISGLVVKNLFGLQGEMLLREGESSAHVTLPHTYALKRNGEQIRLSSFSPATYQFSDLTCELVGYTPHVQVSETPWNKRISPSPLPPTEEQRCPALALEANGHLIAATYNDPLPKEVSFGSIEKKIPYSVTLEKRRKITHPGTDQPYSYEGEISLLDEKGQSTRASLKMNEVYESFDGYRFYLAGIGEKKSAQLIVNQDPAKHLLTYPGAWLVVIGSLALFCRLNKK